MGTRTKIATHQRHAGKTAAPSIVVCGGDGLQQRDSVSVHDVTQACRLALTTAAVGEVFNIGSGQPRTILGVAARINDLLGGKARPVITGKYRVGDVRHCFANIENIDKARELLGYVPQMTFAEGLLELAEWLASARAEDRFMHASAELDRRGLTL